MGQRPAANHNAGLHMYSFREFLHIPHLLEQRYGACWCYLFINGSLWNLRQRNGRTGGSCFGLSATCSSQRRGVCEKAAKYQSSIWLEGVLRKTRKRETRTHWKGTCQSKRYLPKLYDCSDQGSCWDGNGFRSNNEARFHLSRFLCTRAIEVRRVDHVCCKCWWKLG